MKTRAYALLTSAVLLMANAVDAQSVAGKKVESDSAPPAPSTQKAGRKIALYPGAAPGSEKWDWSERSITNPNGRPVVMDVVRPVLLHYPAERSKAVGTAMIVAPGGGFRALMMSYEGDDIARRLNVMGVDAFVLKYRLLYTGPGAPPRAPARNAPAPAERPRRFSIMGAYKAQAGQDLIALAADDGRQAVRLVRERGGEFGVQPNRIGMIGFSAGGMVTTETVFGPVASRPDFAAIIYGVGEIKDTPTPAPPLFLAAAADDVMAAGRTVELFSAYRKGKGLAELHIFQMGGHGFPNKGGGADHFMDRLEEWLAANKLLAKSSTGSNGSAPSPRPAAAGVTGTWQAEFDSQVGMQKYVFEFKTEGEKLTGKVTGQLGDRKRAPVDIKEGKVKGNEISFVEILTIMDMEIPITYTGKIAGDEIRLTRKVGDFASEEIRAKRLGAPGSTVPQQSPAGKSGPPAASRIPAKALTATPAAALKVAKDFKVELLYSVPKDKQGSWVNMTVDPKGRLIVSDQNGGLYRILPPVIGGKVADTKVEKLDVALGGAHGLLWAFDSLYVMVNESVNFGGVRPRNGLYRIPSKDGGDTFEKPESLREINGRGEHGAHAVLLGPDRKSLYIVCGNDTRLVNPLDGSRVPTLWGEDRLFPLLASFGGVKPPAGCIYKVDPDGKNWELWSVGYRNAFDIAFNRHGELFTYDSDMEWDVNTPWYRPTRVCLVSSGSEFGFRNGSDNSPPRYVDTLPAICNVGPGSPTGMTFGYSARFPAKYQEALFLCDWSYGKLYALHLTPAGSAYKGELEEFLNGTPLPVTDAIVNSADGALYFTIGGRRTQSGLYRITYVGKESTTPARGDDRSAEARTLRHKLEAFHGRQDSKAVESAWPYLSHEDRFVRFAARVAIEHQNPKEWQERALREKNPVAAINALLALVRAVGQDAVSHPRKAGDPVPGLAMKASILEALGRIDLGKLSESQRSDLLRVYTVLFNRLGGPDSADRSRIIGRLDPLFPAKSYELNADLCQMLVYLEAPGVAGKALKLMADAPTQEEQMDYALSLRMLKTGWTQAQRKEYFAWYQKAASYKGGQTFRATLNHMKRDAVTTLSAKEKEDLKPMLETRLVAATPTVSKSRPFVKQWKLEELAALVETGLTKRDFDRGRRLFGEAQCFSCHRFDNEGGSQAPDLTIVSGRYSARDILEKVLDPDKAISDQYAATIFTLTDGRVVTGRIVNLHGDNMSVMTNMLEPNALVNVDARKIETQERSKVSMMPKGLLDTLKEDEILDLVAYLLSRGDRNHPMFQGAKSAPAPKAATTTRSVIPLWPDRAPGSEDWTQKEVEYRNEWDKKPMIRNVTTPTLTAFLPDPSTATGAAVIICPGGGFRFLSWQSEGTEVAEWLRSRGVAAFVLKYRLMKTAASEEDFRKEMMAFFMSLASRRDTVPRNQEQPGEASRRAIPEDMRKIGALAIADGKQAIKIVRQHAAEWGIKPDRIGIMGFSAGGMVTMGTVMDSDKDSRPDYAAPIYGGGTGGAKVPTDAPPLFILCAADDGLAAAGSVRLYSEWKAAGRPAELHLYEKGGHGFGMTPKGLPVDRWIERYGDWLSQRGLIKAPVPRR